jgi:TctA family transporter
MHSVAATTGDITSVLFGVPGEAISAATVVDGYPMAKKGEAGRALGAALMSSLLGALIGAVALALAVPIVRPLVLTFGSPELFMLSLVGISCITSLSGTTTRGQIKGFAMGLFGLLISTIGQERQSGSLRFDLGMMYLWDGLDFVPVLVGIFAIPEIIDLAVRGTSIAGDRPPENLSSGVMEGVKDTFRHFWLVFRCSIIGVFVGIMPGAGGGVAQWMAYAHAVQSATDSKERGGFGKGDIRGVLGPGAANNSKEGGELIPTVAFGVPGSGAMAILLSGFLIMGYHARTGNVDQASFPHLLDGLDPGDCQCDHGHSVAGDTRSARETDLHSRRTDYSLYFVTGFCRQLYSERADCRSNRHFDFRSAQLFYGAFRLAAPAFRARALFSAK